MDAAIIVDTGVLGKLSNPNIAASNRDCQEWARNVVLGGGVIAIPSIAAYEVKRELIRCAKASGLAELARLCTTWTYLPFDDEAIQKAAEYWALVRNAIGPTAPYAPDAYALDCDAMICAQAWVYSHRNFCKVTIATTNIKDFTMLLDSTHVIDAKEWQDIA